MPNQNQTSKPASNNLPTTADNNTAIPPETDQKDATNSSVNANAIMHDVVDKVRNVHNILIALSSDPSVDEISAAIGLSLCLDRIGKRATSIYSGKTPNALEFLNPSKAFETSSDVLRDFVIALDKDKADHLRYKLDDKYVKIFITPYKSRIDEEDLEFSLGDFNIELVLALNVSSGIDLDDALREHGRVMHDATVVNITNGNPGKFGDIEWSDKTRSSICEMVTAMLYELGGKNALEPDEATALLTGIVAATDHFSNNFTTADALQIGSRLMNSGADRKLIAENISLDSDNMFFIGSTRGTNSESESVKINHDDEDKNEDAPKSDASSEQDSDSTAELSDLKAAAENLIQAENSLSKPTNSNESTSVTIDAEPSSTTTQLASATEPSSETAQSTLATGSSDFTMPEAPIQSPELTPPAFLQPAEAAQSAETMQLDNTAPTVEEATATASFLADESSIGTNKYSKMLDEALAESNATPAMTATPEPIVTPEFDTTPESSTILTPKSVPEFNATPIATPAADQLAAPTIPQLSTSLAAPSQPEIPTSPIFNPALSATPAVASEPEINGVPEINYGPADVNILPPPPAPPIDFNSPVPTPPTI